METLNSSPSGCRGGDVSGHGRSEDERSGSVVPAHPGLSAFTIFWIICHLVFLVTLWGFHSKLSDCQRMCMMHTSEAGELDRVMASKGMRHFCLISKRLVLFSLMSTIILGALGWQVIFAVKIFKKSVCAKFFCKNLVFEFMLVSYAFLNVFDFFLEVTSHTT